MYHTNTRKTWTKILKDICLVPLFKKADNDTGLSQPVLSDEGKLTRGASDNY